MYTTCNQSVYIFLFVWYNERMKVKYELRKSENNDFKFVRDAKITTIFDYAKNISEEELAIRKQKLSIANKGQVSNTKGKHGYNNGIEEKLLFNSEASTYLENGWVKGGLKNKFSPETNRKRSEAIRNYYLKNPEKSKEKGEKISKSKKGKVILLLLSFPLYF